MTREDGVFYRENTLHFYDCDCYKRAKLSTILKYIADIAGEDYTLKGFGHQKLWDDGMVFLLSRTNLKINRMPGVYETVTVSTWERGKKGSQFLRDFELFDQEGGMIACASTAWLLVNPTSRKILRPETFGGFMPKRADKFPDCETAGKLRMPDRKEDVGERTIRYSDLDGNGHVYNSVYGDIACDFLPKELIEREMKGFQINYQSEAVLDETVTIAYASDPDGEGAYIEGRNAAGGNCFLCRFVF